MRGSGRRRAEHVPAGARDVPAARRTEPLPGAGMSSVALLFFYFFSLNLEMPPAPSQGARRAARLAWSIFCVPTVIPLLQRKEEGRTGRCSTKTGWPLEGLPDKTPASEAQKLPGPCLGCRWDFPPPVLPVPAARIDGTFIEG